jgi:Transposase DDE domain
MCKGKYKVVNWPAYNEGLKNRGRLTVWIHQGVLEHWLYRGPQKRGGRRLYSQNCLEVCLTIRKLYQLRFRQTEGFLKSFFCALHLPLPVPHYTLLCRRQRGLPVQLKACKTPCDVVVDSTGVKVYGEGEWKAKVHGRAKQRTWRKVHVLLNPTTQVVEAMVLSPNSKDDASQVASLLKQVPHDIDHFLGDGAYDTLQVQKLLYERSLKQQADVLPIIGLRPNAIVDRKDRPFLKHRNEDVRALQQLGKEHWKCCTNYHERSKAETFFFRYKTIIGAKLQARKLAYQQTEARLSCQLLNQLLQLAKPISIRVA